MDLELRINSVVESVQAPPGESLLAMLRGQGYHSVKQGCETGDCGACTVLVDGIPRPSCVMLAVQAGGCTITTVEGLGSNPQHHLLQESFVDVGAVRCGFCIPGMLLSASALLQRNDNPTESEVREALSGNLCSCTGYVKPVQAVLRAAALMRGESVPPVGSGDVGQNRTGTSDVTGKLPALPTSSVMASTGKLRAITATANQAALTGIDSEFRVVGKPLRDSGATKLAAGKAAFADDSNLPGLLHGRILGSPYAHARIRMIDAAEARALPGVHAVLTYEDVPRIPYARVEHLPSQAGPEDTYCLDTIVRHVGDRVALVAAETPEVAEQALALIRVDYDVLPAILDPRQALASDASSLHPEPESRGIPDAAHNIAARVHTEVGDVEQGFAQADLVVEGEYTASPVQRISLETHSVLTYFDEDGYLVVRTGSQSPHYVHRTLSALLGIPARRLRVIRTSGCDDLGARQALLLEDACSLLTQATGRPVKLAYSRAGEFESGFISHTHILRVKTGVKSDGTIVANQLLLIASTGAYATHPLTLQNAIGVPALSLYPCANMRYIAEVLYTNLPPSGASSAFSISHEVFALESHMNEVAKRLGMDALSVRRKNWLRAGDSHRLVYGYNAEASLIESCGLAQCLQIVQEKLDQDELIREDREDGRGHIPVKRGRGFALAMDGGASPGVSGAIAKLNEDGSFDIFVPASSGGATTVLIQVAAEVLDVSPEAVLIRCDDTRNTPPEMNAQTSWYNSIGAVRRAAEQARRQILTTAGRMLHVLPESLKTSAGAILAPNGQSVTVAEVAEYALYTEGRHIIAVASWKGAQTPTTFAAQGVEVEVDSETGSVRVLKVVTAVDGGTFINPLLAEGQIQGSITMALGAGLCEELLYDQRGASLSRRFGDYKVPNASDMPEVQTYLVESDDASVPFGAKAVALAPLHGLAAAIANAVADAAGVRVRQLPLTPERVLRALHARRKG